MNKKQILVTYIKAKNGVIPENRFVVNDEKEDYINELLPVPGGPSIPLNGLENASFTPSF